ncbi:hypothetical protein Tco_0202159, partial [Tanacetum coccineum]
ICIRELTTSSLVSVICHPVEDSFATSVDLRELWKIDKDVRLEFGMPLIFRLARRYSTLESLDKTNGPLE